MTRITKTPPRTKRRTASRKPSTSPTTRKAIPSFSESRTKREHIRAEKEGLLLKKMRGELVEVAAVEKQAFAVGRQVRDALLSLPDRLSGPLSAMTSQHEVHALLAAELHQALEALAGSPDHPRSP